MIVLVVDADSDDGQEIAFRLADQGIDVIVTARDDTRARAVAKRLWDEGLDTAHPRVLDAGARPSVEKLRASLLAEFQHVDVLVEPVDRGARAALGLATLLRNDGTSRVVVLGDADGVDLDALGRELGQTVAVERADTVEAAARLAAAL